MPDLEERVAALEAAVAMFARKLLQSGDISINDARAAMGLPAFREQWADSAGYAKAAAHRPAVLQPRVRA
jgi:hypothetical protein